jgi:hypothetical protein
MTKQKEKKTAKRNPEVKRKPLKAGTVLYLRKWPILRPFSYTKLMYEYNICHEGLAFNKSNNGVIFTYTHTHTYLELFGFTAFPVAVPHGGTATGNAVNHKRLKWETLTLLFCQIAKSISPCGLPESPSRCPQISNFLGCSRSEFFLRMCPNFCPKKSKLHLIFFIKKIPHFA